MTPLAARVIRDAEANLGVHETPDGSNSGPFVDQYLQFVGLPPGNPWCCAFAIFRVHHAAGELGLTSRLPKTASTSALYRWYRDNHLLLAAPVAGCIGMVKGGPTGHHHTVIVTGVQGNRIFTVEGNESNRVMENTRLVHECDYGAIA